jgi:hypothetical protein
MQSPTPAPAPRADAGGVRRFRSTTGTVLSQIAEFSGLKNGLREPRRDLGGDGDQPEPRRSREANASSTVPRLHQVPTRAVHTRSSSATSSVHRATKSGVGRRAARTPGGRALHQAGVRRRSRARQHRRDICGHADPVAVLRILNAQRKGQSGKCKYAQGAFFSVCQLTPQADRPYVTTLMLRRFLVTMRKAVLAAVVVG